MLLAGRSEHFALRQFRGAHEPQAPHEALVFVCLFRGGALPERPQPVLNEVLNESVNLLSSTAGSAVPDPRPSMLARLKNACLQSPAEFRPVA